MSASSDAVTTTGIIIGDELLSGKVTEDNSDFLVQELRRIGTRLEALHVLPDEIEVLARYFREASQRSDYVVTSGGLGPTHDDRTMDAVAEAFDVPIVRNNTYEDILKNVYGQETDERVLRMADLPEGIEFEWGDLLDIPAARFKNMFILPGNPNLFRSKFSAVREHLRSEDTFYCHKIYLDVPESSVTDMLEELQNNFPSVDVGSYPTPWKEEFREMVTIESTSEYEVERASRELLDQLDPEHIIRREEE